MKLDMEIVKRSYVNLVRLGIRGIETVPESIRAEVEAILNVGKN